MISPEQFTEKTSEMLNKSAELSKSYSHSQITPIHLASALIFDKDSLFRSILQKAGADATHCERRIQAMLVKQPSQSPAPSEISFSPAFRNLLQKADDVRKTQKVRYV
jgi:ATP-dependent Clp protease ATP-binding subunit ClpB